MTECHYLSYKFSGLVGGVEYLFQIRLRGISLLHFFLRHFNVSQDNGKEVVEIMNDTPSHGADGLHFFCLLELDSKPLAFLFRLPALVYLFL